MLDKAEQRDAQVNSGNARSEISGSDHSLILLSHSFEPQRGEEYRPLLRRRKILTPTQVAGHRDLRRPHGKVERCMAAKLMVVLQAGGRQPGAIEMVKLSGRAAETNLLGPPAPAKHSPQPT